MKHDNHGPEGQTRRDFNRLVALAVGGVIAGASLSGCGGETEGDGGDDDSASTEAKHICKGQNECKGLGGCGTTAGKNECKGQGNCAAASAKHDCAGKNECKGQGGCGTTAGKNDCKGQGECAVPVKDH